MSPELKTWIDAICDAATVGEQHEGQDSQEPTENVSSQGGVFAWFAGILNVDGSHDTELRRIREVEAAINECFRRRDAIGYHGLG
jgi:hypothetical protein